MEVGFTIHAKGSPLDAKRRLEFLLLLSTLAAGYLYLWVYQVHLGIVMSLLDLDELLGFSFVTLLLWLLYYLWVKSDPLQRSHFQWRSIQFFQAEFPSNYILERCSACVETPESCKNFIKQESADHVNIWFNEIWRGIFKDKYPDRFESTFERGYTCKLAFGLSLVLGFFGLLGVLTAVVAYLVAVGTGAPFDLRTVFFLYPAGCFGIVGAIGIFNRPVTEHPSGCWEAWREINKGHILWLRHNEPLLVEKVCHACGNTKTFQRRE